jgi:hypothetical protein
MDQVKNDTEQASTSPANSAETVVETVARKVGATVGAIASKVTSASKKPKGSANAHEERRYQIKKKKKMAHRRKLKGSHTKG